ncbi:MAG: hydroxymethylbilane synthase [Deltaproteobacteria bacterium]|nr:hydroxymethylbilane synthase [Deltaproteobacteria bacterium]
MTRLRLGTRGSLLARTQSGHVADALVAAHPGLEIETVIIRTRGDEITDVPLVAVGGKGLFVKEIEQALADGGIDLAVHSMKDMPAGVPKGLVIGATPRREDPRDALIGAGGKSLAALPHGATIGTSSVRRSCQLRAQRPDLQFQPLRGNVDTRLRKLQDGQVDAIILAAAGLRRLGREAEITELLEPELCLPAIGQGILAIEVREGDARTRELVAVLDDPEAARAAAAERAFLETLGGDCQTPLCAHARAVSGAFRIDGFVASLDGTRILRDAAVTPPDVDAAATRAMGQALAERLLAAGAGELLAR